MSDPKIRFDWRFEQYFASDVSPSPFMNSVRVVPFEMDVFGLAIAANYLTESDIDLPLEILYGPSGGAPSLSVVSATMDRTVQRKYKQWKTSGFGVTSIPALSLVALRAPQLSPGAGVEGQSGNGKFGFSLFLDPPTDYWHRMAWHWDMACFQSGRLDEYENSLRTLPYDMQLQGVSFGYLGSTLDSDGTIPIDYKTPSMTSFERLVNVTATTATSYEVKYDALVMDLPGGTVFGAFDGGNSNTNGRMIEQLEIALWFKKV